MTGLYFNAQKRFSQFAKDTGRLQYTSGKFIISITGWLITFSFALYALLEGSLFSILWMSANGYFWYRLNAQVIQQVDPPIEILFAALLLFFGLDSLLLNIVAGDEGFRFMFWSFQGIIHLILISFSFVMLGWILTFTYKKRQRIISFFILLLYAGHEIVFFENDYFIYFFQVILFIALVKRTAWLELSTRLELAIYFVISFSIFWILQDVTVFERLNESVSINRLYWHSIPYFVFLFLKIYVLTFLVRIPIILIYNHAGLSRKLWIAGLFQSTFPQIIQLVVVLYIFYLFISGWQAENLHKAFEYKQEKIEIKKDFSVNRWHSWFDYETDFLHIEGFEPLVMKSTYPPQGIIQVKISTGSLGASEKVVYFYYLRDDKYYVEKIDYNFLKDLTNRTPVIAGSGLTAHTYVQSRAQKVFKKIEFWTSRRIQTSPFLFQNPFYSSQDYRFWMQRTKFIPDEKLSANINVNLGPIRLDLAQINTGRILIPIENSKKIDQEYLAVDIYYHMSALFKWTFMAKIILLLIVFYMLFNMFIINRVIEFGTQINQTIIQKFDQLKKGIREISSGNLDYKVKMAGEDEFVELGEGFNQMGARLMEKISEVREKDRLDQELKIAREVQLSLLPRELPHIEGYQVCASMETATEVGGDFYDILKISDSQYLFAVGDVSGKGSSAAFYMAQFISLFRFASQFTKDVQDIAVRLNEYVMDRIDDRHLFVTAIFGILDTTSDTVSLVRAGHMKPVLMPGDLKKPVVELDTQGIGIGLTRIREVFKQPLKIKKQKLKARDTIIIYTDGIVEAAKLKSKVVITEDDREVYGEERFTALLNQLRKENASVVLDAISNDINEFYGDCPHVDDHTLFIIQKLSG